MERRGISPSCDWEIFPITWKLRFPLMVGGEGGAGQHIVTAALVGRSVCTQQATTGATLRKYQTRVKALIFKLIVKFFLYSWPEYIYMHGKQLDSS